MGKGGGKKGGEGWGWRAGVGGELGKGSGGEKEGVGEGLGGGGRGVGRWSRRSRRGGRGGWGGPGLLVVFLIGCRVGCQGFARLVINMCWLVCDSCFNKRREKGGGREGDRSAPT